MQKARPSCHRNDEALQLAATHLSAVTLCERAAAAAAERWDQEPVQTNAVLGTDDLTEAHTGNAVQTSESPR